ncbi:MAG: hypothetical protein ACFFDK_01955 [Promethearchaeota archaeon]
MTDYELLDLNTMLIGMIAFFILILIIHSKIEFSRYVPGLMCIIVVFIVQVFENELYLEIFDFIENIAILSGAILLFIATLLEYYALKGK